MDATKYVQSAMNTNLTAEEYARVLERLADLRTLKLLHALLGMVTEVGEAVDTLKKHLIYGKPIDFVNLKEEAGDTFWYQALMARACGFTFEEAFDVNIQKLQKRYGEKFTEEAALNRDLDAERKILEQ